MFDDNFFIQGIKKGTDITSLPFLNLNAKTKSKQKTQILLFLHSVRLS